ncbi:MAG TPA: D-glucuronyl C5-epimerase family protein [Solirubrobacter sp.]|nr:D-glucuronyl C5-epimerase family protein [Solirubrobacter sp.]
MATTAEAAKRPTVAGELKRLAREGAVTPEIAAAHRATYDDARAKVRKFTGARRVQLGGVVKDLEDMARRRQFTPSRLPALFLTLQRNIEWWSSQRLLRSGERVGFPGSELMFQFYPGHGIQIQWLGTFGKLNGYWRGGRRYDARASALLDEAVALASERAGGLAWEYLFPFDGQAPPWVSSLAQGTGLQAMARSATRLGRQAEIFPVAMRGLGIFQTEPPEGVRLDVRSGAHYLQYSGLPKLRILNGFIQSLVGLFDFAQLTGDPTAQALFEDGDKAGRREVPTFDTGAWSLYSRGSIKRESDLGYHKLLRDFLVELCKRTAAEQYCSAHEHFTLYLSEPPEVEVLERTLRPNRSGTLRFKLSKISRVSLRVTRGDTTVAIINPGVFSRGTKSLRWTAPKRSGTYELTVTATDLAGNTASGEGELKISKRT